MKTLKKAEKIKDAPASLISAISEAKKADAGKKQLLKDFKDAKKSYQNAIKDHKRAFYIADRARALGIENARVAEANLKAELDNFEIKSKKGGK